MALVGFVISDAAVRRTCGYIHMYRTYIHVNVICVSYVCVIGDASHLTYICMQSRAHPGMIHTYVCTGKYMAMFDMICR